MRNVEGPQERIAQGSKGPRAMICRKGQIWWDGLREGNCSTIGVVNTLFSPGGLSKLPLPDMERNVFRKGKGQPQDRMVARLGISASSASAPNGPVPLPPSEGPCLSQLVFVWALHQEVHAPALAPPGAMGS